MYHTDIELVLHENGMNASITSRRVRLSRTYVMHADDADESIVMSDGLPYSE